MEEKFKAGDLAMCVRTEDNVDKEGKIGTAGRKLKVGHLYRVKKVTVGDVNGIGTTDCIWSDDFKGHSTAGAWRFKKVHADTKGCGKSFDQMVKELVGG